jgi:short-subunit dehydrogenase
VDSKTRIRQKIINIFYMDPKFFQGKVVWITGASSGIGEALTYAFARAGAILILSARNQGELERVKNNCPDPGAVQILPLDLSNPAEIPEKVEWVFRKFGSLEILINNAGISQRSLAVDSSLDMYRKIFEVDFFGTIQLSNSVLQYFIKRDQGQFVLISSVAGVVGLPLRTGYCAAKHALEGFFSSLRTELWKTPIRILVVRPGAVKTGIAKNALTGDGSKYDREDKIIDNGIAKERVASSILKAIEKNKKVIVTSSAREKFLLALNRFMPGLAFDFVKKIAP